MDIGIVNRLIELNKSFYSQFANEFSETRSSGRLNLRPILPYLNQSGKILDIGCGNGRLAQRLDQENLSLTYLGIDAVPPLVEIAQARGERLHNVRAGFRVADITRRDWRVDLSDFNVAIALAVLHHIPSFDLRVQVLTDIRSTLAPKGTLIMTNWKFDASERLRKKILPWEMLGVDERALEPGDALIAWTRSGIGYRYVHLIAPDEVERLARESGFKIEKQFYADAGLNLYSILRMV